MKEPQEISVFKACHNNRFEIAPFSDDLLLTSTSHSGGGADGYLTLYDNGAVPTSCFKKRFQRARRKKNVKRKKSNRSNLKFEHNFEKLIVWAARRQWGEKMPLKKLPGL